MPEITQGRNHGADAALTSQAVSAGQVIVFSGVPVGVTVALATGLIVIVGADAYYILTKDAISDE